MSFFYSRLIQQSPLYVGLEAFVDPFSNSLQVNQASNAVYNYLSVSDIQNSTTLLTHTTYTDLELKSQGLFTVVNVNGDGETVSTASALSISDDKNKFDGDLVEVWKNI